MAKRTFLLLFSSSSLESLLLSDDSLELLLFSRMLVFNHRFHNRTGVLLQPLLLRLLNLKRLSANLRNMLRLGLVLAVLGCERVLLCSDDGGRRFEIVVCGFLNLSLAEVIS